MVQEQTKSIGEATGRLGTKVVEALPGIIGAINGWIFNAAKEVVCWVSQNLCTLIIDIGGLLYMYMIAKKLELYYDTS